MELKEALETRRSIFRFKPEQPDPAKIKQAIEHARWAPNHHLTEPWRFYELGPQVRKVLEEIVFELTKQKKGEKKAEQKVEKIRACPVFIIVTWERSPDNPQRDREDYAATCCAIQNMQLSLWEQGIGAKWGTGGVTRDDRFYKAMQIDRNKEEIAGMFWVGIPQVVPRSKRDKAVGDIFHCTA